MDTPPSTNFVKNTFTKFTQKGKKIISKCNKVDPKQHTRLSMIELQPFRPQTEPTTNKT